MWKDKNKTTIITTFQTCKDIVDKKDDTESPLDYLEAAFDKIKKAEIENLRVDDGEKQRIYVTPFKLAKEKRE